MAFKKWGCEFDGPWPNTDILKKCPGIWVVWCQNGHHWKVIEVGESRNVRASVLSRSPEIIRSRRCKGTIHYSATYLSKLSDEARRVRADHISRVACGVD